MVNTGILISNLPLVYPESGLLNLFLLLYLVLFSSLASITLINICFICISDFEKLLYVLSLLLRDVVPPPAHLLHLEPELLPQPQLLLLQVADLLDGEHGEHQGEDQQED